MGFLLVPSFISACLFLLFINNKIGKNVSFIVYRQRFWSRRKVCRLAGEPFYKVFWRSVWAHLRQPSAVGRGVG